MIILWGFFVLHKCTPLLTILFLFKLENHEVPEIPSIKNCIFLNFFYLNTFHDVTIFLLRMDNILPRIHGIEYRCRSLCALEGELEKISFLVGTQSMKQDNAVSTELIFTVYLLSPVCLFL